MYLVVECIPYECSIEEFDSYEEAIEYYNKVNTMNGKIVYLTEIIDVKSK